MPTPRTMKKALNKRQLEEKEKYEQAISDLRTKRRKEKECGWTIDRRRLPILIKHPLSDVTCIHAIIHDTSGKTFTCDNFCVTDLQIANRKCYQHIINDEEIFSD